MGMSPEEQAEFLEGLLSMDDVRFSGVFYRKLRGGSISKSVRTCLVDVNHHARVRAGERADFKVLEEVA